LTLEECRALLAAAPERKGWGRNRAAAKTATPKAVREQAVGEGAGVAVPPAKKKKAAPRKKAAVRKRTVAKQKP
jgi:DNA topoisomerase-1